MNMPRWRLTNQSEFFGLHDKSSLIVRIVDEAIYNNLKSPSIGLDLIV